MITLVVGAQYGGEGKGKICAYLALASRRLDVSCRCGGPNSSHTVVWQGKTFRLRMLPAAAVIRPQISVYYGAGTLIHIETLFEEIKIVGFNGSIFIDPNAGIITDEIIQDQRKDERYKQIGSTLTGTGLASALRASRKLRLAKDFPILNSYIGDVQGKLHNDINLDRNILIEGHQGFGLSNYHGDYPYTSSRDCTVAECLSELGVGALLDRRKTRIVLATKIFPTRNHAGCLGDEISVPEATAIGINEYGGGSWDIPDQRRRVGILDVGFVRRAAIANSATEIALTGGDYLDRRFKGLHKMGKSSVIDSVISALAAAIPQAPVRYISTGPDTTHMIRMPANSTSPHRSTKIPEVDDLLTLY